MSTSINAQNKNKLLVNFNQALEKTPPVLGIQWIDFKKAQESLKVQDENKDIDTAYKVAQAIVGKYNAKLEKEYKNKLNIYENQLEEYKNKIEDYKNKLKKDKITGENYKNKLKKYDAQLKKPSPPLPLEKYEYLGFNELVPYKRFFFVLDKTVFSNIAASLKEGGLKSNYLFHIIFFYKKSDDKHVMFTATSRNAWEIARPFIDRSFAMKIAEQVADIEQITEIQSQNTLNYEEKTTNYYPGAFQVHRTQLLYSLIKRFSAQVHTTSKLYECIDKSHITATAEGLLRIEKGINIEKYPKMLNLFSKYMIEPVSNLAFDWLHFFKPIDFKNSDNEIENEESELREKLDELLVEQIYTFSKNNKAQFASLGHKFTKTFIQSYEKEWQSQTKTKFVAIKTLADITQKIWELIDSALSEEEIKKAFRDFLFTSQLRYKVTHKADEIYPGAVIQNLLGQIPYEQDHYFKLGGMWYKLNADYLRIVHADFRNLLNNKLIQPHNKGWLPRRWIRNIDKKNINYEHEEDYNDAYLEYPYGIEKRYLVFDKIKPNNIEPCDILKYTENSVYLYHVKAELGQDTRDACSQILNSAKLLRSALGIKHPENYLKKLLDAVKMLDPEKSESEKIRNPKIKNQFSDILEEEEVALDKIFNIFQNKKIFFVYAYTPHTKRTPSMEQNVPLDIKPEQLSLISKKLTKNKKDEIFTALKNKGYIDAEGRLSGDFHTMNKKDFTIPGFVKKDVKELFDYLDAFRTSNKTMIAKLELIQLEQNLRELNFELKIMEIPSAKVIQYDSKKDLFFNENINTALGPLSPISKIHIVSLKNIKHLSGESKYQNLSYITAPLYILLNSIDLNNFFHDGEDTILCDIENIIKSTNATESAKLIKQFEETIAKEEIDFDAGKILELILRHLRWPQIKLQNICTLEKNAAENEWPLEVIKIEANTWTLRLPFKEEDSLQNVINDYFSLCSVSSKISRTIGGNKVKNWKEESEVIENPSEFLFIQLDRSNTNEEWNNEELSIDNECVIISEIPYELIGVINYSNQNKLGKDYYTACIKKTPYLENQQWYYYDGKTESEIDKSKIDLSKIYIILLKKNPINKYK